MQTFERWLGVIVTLVAVIWPFAAVWATAHQVILSRTEFVTYLLCWPAAVIGPVLFWNRPHGQKVRHILGAMAMAVCSSAMVFMILFVALRYSDRMFTRVLMARNPQPSWQQIISDVSRIGEESAAKKQFGIISQLPASLKRLGRPEESSGVNVLEFGEDDFGVAVTYGGRNRRWGLLVGPDEFLNYSSWKKYKHIPVSTNAVFFVGPDW